MKPRDINPLDPVYQIPGRNETPVDLINDPYGEKGCSMSKQNFKSSKNLTAIKPPMPSSAKGSGPRPQTASQKTPSLKIGSRRQSEAAISKGPSLGSSRSKANLTSA